MDNFDDIIDSRDVLARIEALEALEDEADEDEAEELRVLHQLAAEASESPDWQYGEALIRDSYFEAYAEELAEDIGAIDRNATWPLCHIDWEAAADSLKADYMSVDFDGVDYWIMG